LGAGSNSLPTKQKKQPTKKQELYLLVFS